MTTARELLQEALTYSNAWLTALEADGEDEAAASQAEFNERITSFLAQPEPEPVFWTAREIETGDFETSAEVHCSKPDFDAGEGWEWVPLYAAQPEVKP